MKGSISWEKDRNAYCVSWYHNGRPWTLRHYYGVKLYTEELAKKLRALLQATWERSQRGECVFRIENFQKGASIDVCELLDGWILTKARLKPGGLKSYKSHVKIWLKPFFLQHQIGVHEITLDVLTKLKTFVEFAGRPPKEGVKPSRSPKTVKNVMESTHSFLDYAWRNGNIPAIPPFPKNSEYGLGVKEIPTIPREVQFEIIKLMPTKHQPIFYWLILHPGRRPGEARAIFKEDYSRFRDSFYIKRTISDRQLVEFPKNWSVHEAACNEMFEPFLEDLLATDGPFLFVNPRGTLPGKRYTEGVLARAWNKACAKRGVTINLYNGTKHSTLDYFYNDLGVPLTDLMDLTGHKNLDCIKHYARMRVGRQRSLLALESDKKHLALIHGGQKKVAI